MHLILIILSRIDNFYGRSIALMIYLSQISCFLSLYIMQCVWEWYLQGHFKMSIRMIIISVAKDIMVFSLGTMCICTLYIMKLHTYFQLLLNVYVWDTFHLCALWQMNQWIKGDYSMARRIVSHTCMNSWNQLTRRNIDNKKWNVIVILCQQILVLFMMKHNHPM